MSKKYTQFIGHLERSPIILFGEVAVGASGAPTLNTAGSQGFASVVRDSTGRYTFTLDELYNRITHCHINFKIDGGPTAETSSVRQDNVSTTKKFTVDCRDDSGLNVDPTNGVTMLVQLWLSDHDRIG